MGISTYWAALDGSFLGGFTENNPDLPIHSIQVPIPPPIGIGDALQGDFRWDGEKWTIPIGGADLFRDYAEELVQFDTNSTTYIDVLTHVYNVPFTGQYMITVGHIWNSTSPNQSIGFQLLLDAIPAGEILMESNTSDVADRNSTVLFRRFPLIVGGRTFVLQTKVTLPGQTISLFRSSIKFERWE